jgi:hypothetical protein
MTVISVAHQDWKIGVIQHELGYPSTKQVVQRAIRVGAHDEEIGCQFVDLGPQGLSEPPSANGQEMQIGGHPGFSQNLRDAWRRFPPAKSDEQGHTLRSCEEGRPSKSSGAGHHNSQAHRR